MSTPAWVATRTWATDEIPTAAQANNYWRDGLDHVAKPCGAQAKRTASGFSIPGSTVTALELNAENWDTDAIHDNSTNPSRFTIPTDMDGHYLFTASVTFAFSAGGTIRYLMLYKNGSPIVTSPGHLLDAKVPFPAVWSVCLTGSREVSVAAGDYLEARVFQDSGGALDVTDATVSIRKVSN